MTDTAPTSPKGWDVDTTARAMGCSRGKVYDLIKRGELRTYTIGRARRVLIDSVDAYIAANTDSAA